MNDLISRQAAIEVADAIWTVTGDKNVAKVWQQLKDLPSVQPIQEDYTEMKREFLRMANYIDILLVCPDEQKETLMNFISQIADDMPWTQED